MEAWQDTEMQSKVVALSLEKDCGPAAGGPGVRAGRVPPALAFSLVKGFN